MLDLCRLIFRVVIDLLVAFQRMFCPSCGSPCNGSRCYLTAVGALACKRQSHPTVSEGNQSESICF